MREPDRDLDIQAMALLRDHGEQEGGALESYRKLAEQSDNDWVRYLVGLIMEDETRHHRVIGEMLHRVQSYVWEVDVPHSVPAIGSPLDANLVDATQKLIAMEKSDGDELKRLRAALASGGSRSLLSLLVDMMIHDTAKHVLMLEFLYAHAASR